MGKINKKAMLFSLILTVICAVVLFNYIGTIKSPVEEKAKTGILVAIRDIQPGETILQVDLKVMEVSTDSIPEGIIREKEKIENKIAKERILAGEPFRESRLTSADKMAISYTVPEGMRAISVFVSESTILSNLIRVGDTVDVISSFKKEAEDQMYKRTTKTTVENAIVAAIGPDRYNSMDNSVAGETAKKGVDDMPRTVTLFVQPEDAERIAFTVSFGEVYLALRARGDEASGNTSGVIIEDVTPDKSIFEDDGSGSVVSAE